MSMKMGIVASMHKKLQDKKDTIIGGIVLTTLMSVIVLSASSCSQFREEPWNPKKVHCKWHSEFTEWCGECRHERFLKTGKRVYKPSEQ